MTFVLDTSANASSAALSPRGDGECLHELFEAQADLSGDAIALECGGLTLTYAELDARTNQLAHLLRSKSIGPGSFVGICLERSEVAILAILGCLKSGAAYVPLNPAHPDDRLRFIMFEAEVTAVLALQEYAPRVSELFDGLVLSLDMGNAEVAAQPTHRLQRYDTGLVPSDICYVLYTSGTTGRPKGVVAEHRNVTHFVHAFNKACTTTSADRIFQGFSLSFDGSVEEMWMAFSNGATLVVPEPEAPRFGNDLARYLSRTGISYFSTVPTLLSTMTEDVPSLRQLVVSGEPCPPELVTRWSRDGRAMLNVYGPTEATVNTTVALLEPGRPVTIGRPIPGYRTLILNEEMQPVAPGEKGELYVGGPGISRGYLKQPEITARSFIRLYKTGDLARVNEDGELEFFGRIDGQVKLRGYRIELPEIEAVLFEDPDVGATAVRVYEGDDEPCLAAYVVLKEGATALDRSRLLASLRSRLPAYMVPTYLDVVDALPMLSTGKVDRRQLPMPVSPLVEAATVAEEPATALESQMAAIWATTLKLPSVGTEQNFFLDLGGHSLLAARLVAALREDGIEIAVRDLYARPTVKLLAELVADRRNPGSEEVIENSAPAAPREVPVLRKTSVLAVVVQAAFYLTIVPLLALPLLVTVPPIVEMLYFKRTVLEVFLFLLIVGFSLWPALILIGVGSKWVLIGRYKPGAYPLWGGYYIRWWLVSRLQTLTGLGVFAGTPFAPWIWRLMGARIGAHCLLQCRAPSAWDCIRIGDDTSLAFDTQLPGIRIEDGYLLVGNVDIGSRCFVGCHSFLGLDTRMEDDAFLDDQSLLPDGHTIAAGQAYRGSPAEPVAARPQLDAPVRRSLPHQWAFCLVQLFSMVMLSLLLATPSMFVGFGMGFLIVHASPAVWVPLLILSVPLLIIFFCCYLAWCKNAVCPPLRPGTYKLYSYAYLQFWLMTTIMHIVRLFGWIIFTTIYLPPWMRLLGAKLGKHAEMSTVWSLYPDLLEVGDGVFMADGCILSASRFHLGRFTIAKAAIGDRTFIGNSALLPSGVNIGSDCLLGVLSVPPYLGKAIPDGTDWLGSPAFQLPSRLKVTGFDAKTTYTPTPALYIKRGVIDALRILIPAYLVMFLTTTAFVIGLGLYNGFGLWAAYLATPILFWTSLFVSVGVTVAVKWAAMGTFKPVVVPLWSSYVWLNEMVAGVYETVMGPIVSLFFGTPFAAPLLRLLGCRVGKHCYIGSDLFSEFDLVEIGDYVALNDVSVIQTHLFEDRIMKSSYLRIGDGCSVGNMSVVLYDTQMEPRSVLGPLSLLMKGETMPKDVHWHGIPTVSVTQREDRNGIKLETPQEKKEVVLQ